MRLTRQQIQDLRGRSPEGAYQLIRQFVREEHGSVSREELAEAVQDAIRAGLLDESDVRRIEES